MHYKAAFKAAFFVGTYWMFMMNRVRGANIF